MKASVLTGFALHAHAGNQFGKISNTQGAAAAGTGSANWREPIPREQIETLRARLPQYLTLRLGIEDLSRPFHCPSVDHDDANPSAHYYAPGQVVKCFGCGRSWDVFDLAGMLENADSFTERVRAVAQATGTELQEGYRRRPMPTRTFVDNAVSKASQPARRDISLPVMESFEALYTREGDAARRWLIECRGITDDDIVRYGLGFSLKPKSVMPELGAFEPSCLGFVTIPFWDDERCGSVSYAIVRTVPSEDSEIRVKEWRPKGVPSTLWQGWALSAGLAVVYLTEGPLDAIALEKMSGRRCVALCGTTMAGAFLHRLAEVPEGLRPRRVVLCMDADDAGARAAEQLSEGLGALGIDHAKMPEYPGGAKDANEWLLAGRGKTWDAEIVEESPCTGVSALTRTTWRDGHNG